MKKHMGLKMIELHLSARINGVFIGKIENRWPDKPSSAIQKNEVFGSQNILLAGLEKDAQADLAVHGGPDKALHHYAADHYPFWQAKNQMPSGTIPAAFGENISTIGLTEENLCIGDILRLGSALVQISQGRQPCWKLGHHTGNAKMPKLFQTTGRTGWYYRVLEVGQVSPLDTITLIERPNPDWTVKFVTQARLTRSLNTWQASILANLPELAKSWRNAFAKIAEGNHDEDTSARLKG